MQVAFSIVIVAISLVGAIFLSLGILRLSRRVQEHAARTAVERAEKLALIPFTERIASYVAVGLVIASILAFRWAPGDGGSDIRILALATGVTALSYLVWFSARWWHLK
jgi:hypothetical protein